MGVSTALGGLALTCHSTAVQQTVIRRATWGK